VKTSVDPVEVYVHGRLTLNVGRGKKTHKTELSTKASPFRSAIKIKEIPKDGKLKNQI